MTNINQKRINQRDRPYNPKSNIKLESVEEFKENIRNSLRENSMYSIFQTLAFLYEAGRLYRAAKNRNIDTSQEILSIIQFFEIPEDYKQK